MQYPTTDDVIDLVRERFGVPEKTFIGTGTRLCDDLGFTGDDGDELLLGAEQKFHVKFPDDEGFRELFALKPNEYLFISEGVDLIGISVLINWLRGIPREVVVDLTIAELHQAICKLIDADEEAGRIR